MQTIYTEPIVIADIYVSGIAEIEDLEDGSYRITSYKRQKSVHDGIVENVVVDKQIMTTSALLQMATSIMKALGYRCCGGSRLPMN